MILPNKHLSQVQTLKLHINLCHNHHRSKMTTLQCLRSTILLQKISRKTDLVIFEAADTTYALTQILITQRYTDIDECKIFFKPLFVRHVHSLPLSFSFFANIVQIFSFFGSTYINKSSITSTTLTKVNRILAFELIKITNNRHYHQDEKTAVLKHKFSQQQA